jgi:hypothetical protein
MPTIAVFYGIIIQMFHREHGPPHVHAKYHGGPMVEPLRDPAFFARVFLEYGTLTWPNGFDLDAIALHQEMKAAGQLRMPAA